MMGAARSFRLRLPATSANLGPAFDTAAVALKLHLEIKAVRSNAFSISAEGRDAARCGELDRNLILETYRRILLDDQRCVEPLHLEVKNEIPLGMGCGSSAAARLAGIALAVEFGALGWSEQRILATATSLEGHPDNVTACWLGGMTVSAVSRVGAIEPGRQGGFPRVAVARIDTPAAWSAAVVFPRDPVRTEYSRRILPSHYSRPDVVQNLQHCGLLVAAFASGSGELLRAAMHDRLHQPYRTGICPLLEELQPLARIPGVLGVALSGAGPGVLLIVDGGLQRDVLRRELGWVLERRGAFEVLQCGFESRGAGSAPSGEESARPKYPSSALPFE